ncbi:MAG TPA: hypothetical protein VIK33_07040 [Anaerolineae bacterium]
MIQVHLMPEEAEMLRDMLQGCLSDLRTEIRHTDSRDYRGMLKKQETSLKMLLERLEAASLNALALA